MPITVSAAKVRDRFTVEAEPEPDPDPEPGEVTHGREINAANTGIAYAGLVEGDLTATGATNYTTNGQVIENRIFSGTVRLTGGDQTLRNCVIRIGGYATFALRVQSSGCTIENCLITSDTGFYEGISVENVSDTTIRRVDGGHGENILTVTGSGSGLLIEECYFHDVNHESDPSGHIDVVEIYGGNDTTIRRSKITMADESTSPINIAPWSGSTSVDNTLIEDNYIGGGQALVLVDLQSSGDITNTRVLRNDMNGNTGPWGRYYALWNSDGRTIHQTEGALTAAPSGILWPSTGDDVNHWVDVSNLSPDRTGQVAVPGQQA